MNGEKPKPYSVPAEAPSEGESPVPRTGSGAQTALVAMLRKRQMRAGAEPQPPQTDGSRRRKK
jgi:hypothetical protein